MAFNVPAYQRTAPSPFELLKYIQGRQQQQRQGAARKEQRDIQNALLQKKLAGDPQGTALKNMLVQARINLLKQQAGAFGRKGAVMGMDAMGRPMIIPGTGQPQGPQIPGAPGATGVAPTPAMVPPPGLTGAQGGPQQTVPLRGGLGVPGGQQPTAPMPQGGGIPGQAPGSQQQPGGQPQQQGYFEKSGFAHPARKGTGGTNVTNPWTGEVLSILTPGNVAKLQTQHRAYKTVIPQLKRLIELGAQGYEAAGGKPTILQPNLRADYLGTLNQIVDKMVKAQALPNTRAGLETVRRIYERGPYETATAYRTRGNRLLNELMTQLGGNESILQRGAMTVRKPRGAVVNPSKAAKPASRESIKTPLDDQSLAEILRQRRLL